MAKIGIAGNLVSATAPLGYGHLQLVYSIGNNLAEIEVQSNWRVEDFPFLGPLGRWIFDDQRPHAVNSPFHNSFFHYRIHYFNLDDDGLSLSGLSLTSPRFDIEALVPAMHCWRAI